MLVQKALDVDFYGDRLPRDIPFYSVGEAARCLRLPSSAVRDWAVGRPDPIRNGSSSSPPIIEPADPTRSMLSFRNLVEIHVLSSIRRIHKIKLQAVRDAIGHLRDRLGSEHPLFDHEMSTDGKDLFVDHLGHLIDVSQRGQMVIREVMELYLRRIERDEAGMPFGLFPFSRPKVEEHSPRLILINPMIRFGRPCIAGTNLPTSIIAERYAAGESTQFLVEDYGRETREIEEAIRYESRIAS